MPERSSSCALLMNPAHKMTSFLAHTYPVFIPEILCIKLAFASPGVPPYPPRSILTFRPV